MMTWLWGHMLKDLTGKCYELEMTTGTGTQDIWLPVSVLSRSVSIPIGILHLWGSIPLSQNGGLELMRVEILFKAEILWVNVLNFLLVELLLCKDLYTEQKMPYSQNQPWKFHVGDEFNIYHFYMISTQVLDG